MLILRLEALPFESLAPESAHHAHAGQIFLGDCGQMSLLAVDLLKLIPDETVKNDRADDHDRNKNGGGSRQLRLNRHHKIQGHENQDKDMEQRGELLGDKDLDRLDIRGTALDDIPRAVLPLPGVRKGEDLSEQLVPCPLHKELCPLFITDAEGVAADCSRHRCQGYCCRREPKVGPQLFLHPGEISQPSQGSQHPGWKSAQLSSDHHIYRHLDQTRNDQIEQCDQTRENSTRYKIADAPSQKI